MSLKQTHLERFISIIPLPYYLSGTVICLLFFFISDFIIIFFEKTYKYTFSCFVLSILFALQCVIVFWAHGKISLLRDIIVEMIDLPKEMTYKWHEEQEAVIFDDKNMFLVGVVVTIMAHMLGLDYFGFSFSSIYSFFVFKLDYYLAHYIMGAALYIWIATGLMLFRMSRLPLDINILLSKNIRLKGIIYSKFAIFALIVYLIWGIFHISTPARLSSSLSLLWFSSFALLLLTNFIASHYIIYKIIIKTKREKLDIFLSKLQKIAEEALQNPSRERLLRLNNMLGVLERLDEMCEWPFGSYEIFHILLIVIIPLMALVIEFIVEIARHH